MAKMIDMTGRRIGKLTVRELDLNKKSSRHVFWICDCDCGNTVSIDGVSLRRHFPTSSCGCLKKSHFVDLTDSKFNDITLIKHIGKDKEKNQIYLAKCICGNEFKIQGSDAKTGKIKSCGCGKFKHVVENYLNDTNKPHQTQLFASYKNASKKRGHQFELTLEEFIKLIEQECYYCGDSGSNIHSHFKRRKSSPKSTKYLYNGIDRINNDIGYTKDNCVPCCKPCNISKHTLTQDYFIERAYKIVEREEQRKALREAIAREKDGDNGSGGLY